MAEKEKKFMIDVFRKKDAGELTAALADPAGKLEIPSAAALCGAESCAMALRAARVCASAGIGGERMDYILRNMDKLREYLVYLIDEDVKGRNILLRAMKEGDVQKIDAARQPACAISDEIICEMLHLIELMEELIGFDVTECATYLSAALEFAMSAIRCAVLYAVDQSSKSSDETYAFVVRRENELRLEQLRPKMEAIKAWTGDKLR